MDKKEIPWEPPSQTEEEKEALMATLMTPSERAFLDKTLEIFGEKGVPAKVDSVKPRKAGPLNYRGILRRALERYRNNWD